MTVIAIVNTICWTTGVIVWVAYFLYVVVTICDWIAYVVTNQLLAKKRKDVGMKFCEYYWLRFQMGIYDAKRFWKK